MPVLYAAVRALLGTRAALLSALALAVAPYAVSFSNYARGFTLATLGMLVALWAAARLARGGPSRWWWLYAAGAVGALYSEYVAALFLVPLALALTTLRPSPRTLGLALAPFLALLPWIGEIDRSRDFAGVTKVDPTYPGPSPGSLRDSVVSLAFGEHGSSGSVGRPLAAVPRDRGRGRRRARAGGPSLAGRGRLAGWHGRGHAGSSRAYCASGAGCVRSALHDRADPAGRRAGRRRGGRRAVARGGAGCRGGAGGRGRCRGGAAHRPRARARLLARGAGRPRGRRPDGAHQQRGDRVLPPAPAAHARPPLRARHRDRAGGGRPYAVVDDSRVGAGARPGPGRRTTIGPIVIRVVR